LKADRGLQNLKQILTPHPALSPIGREGKDEGEIRGIGKRITALYEYWNPIGDLNFEVWISCGPGRRYS
jgi:hypothetical protein